MSSESRCAREGCGLPESDAVHVASNDWGIGTVERQTEKGWIAIHAFVAETPVEAPRPLLDFEGETTTGPDKNMPYYCQACGTSYDHRPCPKCFPAAPAHQTPPSEPMETPPELLAILRDKKLDLTMADREFIADNLTALASLRADRERIREALLAIDMTMEQVPHASIGGESLYTQARRLAGLHNEVRAMLAAALRQEQQTPQDSKNNPINGTGLSLG